MEKKQLLKRLHHLEEEIQLIKADLEPTIKRNKFILVLQKVAKFAISHWVLISFLVAIAIAVYAKFQFGVDYFENYRNISTTKELAEFYRKLGDRMIACGEWKAAEDAYRSALEINRNNIRATYGILKAKVFQPLEGQKFYVPEVVDAKLEHLLSVPAVHNEAGIYFLKGVRCSHQGNVKEAISEYQKAIEKNPEFVVSYLNLGDIHMGSYDAKEDKWHVDIDEAISNFKKALQSDPNYPLANNKLGFCYIITGDFAEAINHLKKSYHMSPSLLAAINLGDACCFSGDCKSALRWHTHALEVMKKPEIEKERYVAGHWTFNYMPQEPDDSKTIRRFVKVASLEEKRVFVHYALSFDYALAEKFGHASEHFEEALHLDKSGRYRDYFKNKILYIMNFCKLKENVKPWFLNHMQKLSSG